MTFDVAWMRGSVEDQVIREGERLVCMILYWIFFVFYGSSMAQFSKVLG